MPLLMKNPLRLLFILLAITLAGPGRNAFGQLIIGQYEEEAPLGSWNARGALSAASLGMGGVGAAAVFDTTCLVSNPALLSKLPRFTAAVGGSRMSASLFRYGLVNTGVLETYYKPVSAFTSLDFAGFSIRAGSWTAALSVHQEECYDRPAVDYSYLYGGRPIYNLGFRQEGDLRIVSFGLARKLGSSIGAGLAVHAARGRMETAFEESWTYSYVYITDERSRTLEGLFLSAGLTWDILPHVVLALSGTPPSILKARSRSLLGYRAPLGGTDIRIAGAADDETRRPWLLRAGAAFTPSANFRTAVEIHVSGWTSYRIRSFGEDLDRPFRNTATLRFGAEYRIRQRLFGRIVSIPLRAGGFFDPQPMRAPRSVYRHVTLGSGLESGRVRVSFALSAGRESGSGHGLSITRGALSLAYLWGDDR